MEVVLVHLAKGAKYQYGLDYKLQKTIHFVHDIEDFEKITDTEAWKKIEYCIHMLHELPRNCFEIVQVDGRSAQATTIFNNSVPWRTAFVQRIKYGDWIEIRFTGNVIRGPIKHFEMRQIRVNLHENETYSSDVSYDNRTTCEYTHYYYLPEIGYMHLYPDSLNNTNNFPLFETVKQKDCMEVLYKPYSNVGNPQAESLWKRGSDLKLKKTIRIVHGDVIEIRVVVYKVNNDDKLKNDDQVQNDDPDDECVICMEKPRNIVLMPCRHQCICKACYDGVIAKAHKNEENPRCPFCRQEIQSFLYKNSWNETIHGEIMNVTGDVGGVYGLLASLRRHCVEDTQVDDLLRK